MFIRILATALLGAPLCAQAHAHLERSVPAQDAHLSTAPSTVILIFSEATRLTACWLESPGAPKQKLSNLPEQSARELTIPVTASAAGVYRMSWRAVSADGHIASGELRFTVAAPSSH